MNLLRELVTEQDEKHIPLAEAIEEAVKDWGQNTKGGVLGGAKAFFKANPTLIAGAGALAVLAHKAYRKNKRNTISLHAKSPYERKMMTSVVDALTGSGKFKVQRVRFEGGGKSWTLKRTWS